MPHVDFSILVVIQLFNSVSRHPYREDGFLLIQICNRLRGLYLVNENELATMAELFEEFAQQQMEGCSGFVFSKDLCQHFL